MPARIYRFEIREDEWSSGRPNRCRAWDPAFDRHVVLTRFNVPGQKSNPSPLVEAAIRQATGIHPDVEVFTNDGILYVAALDDQSARPVLTALQAAGIGLDLPQLNPPQPEPPKKVGPAASSWKKEIGVESGHVPAADLRQQTSPPSAARSPWGMLLAAFGLSAVAAVVLMALFWRADNGRQSQIQRHEQATKSPGRFNARKRVAKSLPKSTFQRKPTRAPADRVSQDLAKNEPPPEPRAVLLPSPVNPADHSANRQEHTPQQPPTGQPTPTQEQPERSTKADLTPNQTARTPLPSRIAVNEPQYSAAPSASDYPRPAPAEPSPPALEARPIVPNAVVPRPYDGPREGTLIWSGEVAKNQQIRISGSTASYGSISGNFFPGRPIQITLNSTGFAVVRTPNPLNRFSELVLQSAIKGRIALTIHWTVLP